MIHLNVGNKWNPDFLSKVHRLNEQHSRDGIWVTEVYGSVAGILPTARSKDRLPSLPREKVEDYVQLARSYGIIINYTVNASCIGPLQDFPTDRFINDLDWLLDIGVTHYTVASDLLADIIVSRSQDARLKVSTICRVHTVQEIKNWLDSFPQVYAITLDHGALKDLPLVKRLAAYCRRRGVYLEVLANEFCNYYCHRRFFCYNLSSHDSERGPHGYYPFGWCWQLKKDPINWVRAPVILPQDLDSYSRETGVCHFKITGRTAKDETILKILEAYMAKKWEGNLLELWPTISHLAGDEDISNQIYIDTKALGSLVSVWKSLGTPCQLRDCQECGVCRGLLEKAWRRA